MRERPILFSGSMVRAILDGKKTMTRRVVKHQDCEVMNQRPYKPGDRLWVRETWAQPGCNNELNDSYPELVVYRADNSTAFSTMKWRPSIFMPRWASRITLEITAVRVERLQEIRTRDIIAEGYPIPDAKDYAPDDVFKEIRESPVPCLTAAALIKAVGQTPKQWFYPLWDSINGKKYPWSSNPWVWVISFKKQEADHE